MFIRKNVTVYNILQFRNKYIKNKMIFFIYLKIDVKKIWITTIWFFFVIKGKKNKHVNNLHKINNEKALKLLKVKAKIHNFDLWWKQFLPCLKIQSIKNLSYELILCCKGSFLGNLNLKMNVTTNAAIKILICYQFFITFNVSFQKELLSIVKLKTEFTVQMHMTVPNSNPFILS